MSGKSKNPLTALTAGCIAGGIEATAVWPMEFIKVKKRERYRVMKKSILKVDSFLSLYTHDGY